MFPFLAYGMPTLVFVGLAVAVVRLKNVVLGVWVAAGGPWRPPRREVFLLPHEAPASARPLPPGHFFPTYSPGLYTPPELVEALGLSPDPVGVDQVRRICKNFKVKAELRDLAGRVQITVDEHGHTKHLAPPSPPRRR